MRRAPLLAATVLAAVSAAPAAAQSTPTATAAPVVELEEVVVTGRRPYTTAASSEVRARDFELRPKNRPGDLARLVPGLVIAQHQGGGKAEQYFLRGFDADHGTDVLLLVDDVPVNMRSHAHGQGYADGHWIIPEVIERVEVKKGPYFVELGDFATAGALRMVTRRRFAESFVSAAGGMWNTQRYVTALGREVGGTDLVGAFELYYSDGPYDEEMDYLRLNGFAKAALPLGDAADLSLWVSGYSGEWTGSGEIPARAVRRGLIDRYGAIDPTEGGETSRVSAFAGLDADVADDVTAKASLWYSRYELDQWNDFTFFLNDPVNGDEIEQNDQRHLFGGRVELAAALGPTGEIHLRGGIDTRTDIARVRLGTARRRERLGTAQRVAIRESSYGAFLEIEAPLAERVRTVLGARGDYYHFDVRDRLGDDVEGVEDAAVPGATANLIAGPFDGTEVYLNWGMGHHSNDARAIVQDDSVRALPKLFAYEIGARTRVLDGRVDVGVSGFLYDLESELVLVGDEGIVEPRGRTRRIGLELETHARVTDWLFLDGDVSWTEAEFVRTGDAVPLAPRLLGRAGVTARAPFGLEARLEMRHVGERWGVEDRSERTKGYTVFDLFVKYRRPRAEGEPWSLASAIEVFATIENLFDTEVDEAQFFFESRLQGEPAEGVLDRHFTPGLPFTVTGGVTIYF